MGNSCCCQDSADTDDLARLDRSEEYSRSAHPYSPNNGAGGQRSRRRHAQSRTDSSTPSSRNVAISGDNRRTNTELFRPTSSPMTPKVKDDQMKLAQRQGIISQIPSGVYDMSTQKHTECAICMIDFEVGDEVKYLPCMHIYHKDCIDDWLMRSLRCPSCMEPVDAALLSTFDSY